MHGALHHVELWVPDLTAARATWGWLFDRLGYAPFQEWEHGRSWRLGGCYIVMEESPAMRREAYDRTGPGLNHLAFTVGSRAALDAIVSDATRHGWRLLFPEHHPFAGGSDHYAAYLEDGQGFEVELVAEEPQGNGLNAE
jgi:catechol 2,3-dioxygenase-like lactoylglutathione lyase family enzyme